MKTNYKFLPLQTAKDLSGKDFKSHIENWLSNKGVLYSYSGSKRGWYISPNGTSVNKIPEDIMHHLI